MFKFPILSVLDIPYFRRTFLRVLSPYPSPIRKQFSKLTSLFFFSFFLFFEKSSELHQLHKTESRVVVNGSF